MVSSFSWWWFQNCFYFHPDPWGNDPIWRLHMFQKGFWFHHQLEKVFPISKTESIMWTTKANQPKAFYLDQLVTYTTVDGSKIRWGHQLRSSVVDFSPIHIYVRFWRTISRVVVWDFWTIMNHQQYVRTCWHSNWYCRVFWLPEFHRIFFTYAKGKEDPGRLPSLKLTFYTWIHGWWEDVCLSFWDALIFFQGRGVCC